MPRINLRMIFTCAYFLAACVRPKTTSSQVQHESGKIVATLPSILWNDARLTKTPYAATAIGGKELKSPLATQLQKYVHSFHGKLRAEFKGIPEPQVFLG